MPVESTDNRVQYDTNGTTGPWSIPFYFLADADVRVVYADADGNETDLTLDVDYTLTGAGVETGGTCTTTTAYASGGTITVLRDLEALQPEEFTDGDAFPAAALNRGLDRSTMLLQQFQEVIGRSLVIPASENNDMTLPAASVRASKVLAFDANGNPTPIVGVDGGSAAALALDLADAASVSKGAALVGFDPALAYADDTAGRAIQLGGVTPRMFGAVGDNTTDDTTALQAWLASSFPKIGEPLTFKVTGQLTLPAEPIDFRGMVIDASAGGTFTNSAVLYAAGSITAISDLSASPSIRNRSLSFSTAHTLSEGDVFIIFNPTAESFASTFAYAYAGEFCRVQYVSSSAAVKTENGLHAAYTAADVDVYKMAKTQVAFQNLTVIAPNSGNIRPVEIALATRVRIRNFHGYGSNYTGLSLDRCYDVELTGCNVDVNVQVTASKYGIALSNSQDVRIIGGSLNAVRHAINIGGDDKTCAVPNRAVLIQGATLRADSDFTSVPCADIHANSEGITYEGCTIYGGGTFGGRDCSYIRCVFMEAATANSAMIAGGSGWVGGYMNVIGCTFYATGAYPNGVVRAFAGATTAKSDSHLIVKDCTVSMSSCDTFARFDNNHATYKANAHVSGITFLDSASLSNVLRVSGPGTAVSGDYAVVEDIANGKSGASLFVEAAGFTVTKVRLMKQAGTAAITPVSGAAVGTTTVTPRYSYGSRTPAVSLVLAAGTVNSKTVVPYVSSVSAASFGANMRTADSTTMGVTSPDVTAHWTAAVAEV